MNFFDSPGLVIFGSIAALVAHRLYRLFHCTLPLGTSSIYLRLESEDKRIGNIILPFAVSQNAGIVLVWALGRWMIHIVDSKAPSNVLLSNGEQWKRQSKLINAAFDVNLPVEQFVLLARKVCQVIGAGEKTVQWDDLSQRFALDAIGSTALGHDFRAIDTNSPFVADYNSVMHDIANPLYLISPFLEKLLPRRIRKKQDDAGGNDILSYLISDSTISETELRDNMVLLFIAGHDTSAGAISTLVYFLARYPDIQERVRKEVLTVLGSSEEPTTDMLKAERLPFLNACIREALRINTPISTIVPRTAARDVSLGGYAVPAGSSIVLNIYSIHHRTDIWEDVHAFNPERFMKSEWPKASWLPFATGPRQCPARNFAMFEQRTLMAVLLREYEWSLPDNSIHSDGLKNAFSPFALTIPYSLDIIFKKI
ncbi:cytochrome P450 [Flagelloscypha sp. PMI_526]|nr:cytochrome P450 [Flagelloscypha sp. PMI_526]